jgi:CRISPR-associated protein Csd1
MLLKALVERARSEAAGTTTSVLPRFYKLQRVGYRLDLDSAGCPISFQPAQDSVDPDREAELSIPYVNRTSGILPLPVDRGDYVFGIPSKGKSASRAVDAHSKYISLIEEAVEATQNGALLAISRFLSDSLGTVSLPDDFDSSRFVAIFVDGTFFAADEVFQKWWASRSLSSQPSLTDSGLRYCAVCGELTAPVEKVSTNIYGLTSIGGKASMAMVTGNSDVFERHGMKRASGASLCLICANDSHQALNALIADPNRSRTLGDSKILWWTTGECEDLLAAIVKGDSDESVGVLIDSLRTGKVALVPPAARFYAVTIGANVNRVVVRDWLDTSLDDVVQNIKCWIKRIELVDHDGTKLRHPGIFSLLAAVAPPGTGSPLSRISPLLGDKVLRAALSGAALPHTLLAQCLLRIRAGQGEVTVPQASLLKAFLSNGHRQEVPMALLDPDTADVSYRCGRLLAILDSAARSATSAKNDLVDRSYAAASTMPAATFPRLLKLHRAHIDKLRRDNPGAANRIQRAVEEVMSGITNIPRLFSPTEQARFALGLYHQQAADRAARTLATAQKALGKKNTIAESDTDEQEQN